jgi:glycosyltransferase involved in cell wall biosynthesis
MLGLGRARVRRVIAVSDDARQVATGRGRMDPCRTELVINGINVGRFDPSGDGAGVRREFSIADGAFVFGIVARLTPVKDHGTLLRAFARVAAAGDDSARLLIVGGGENELEVRALVEELGLTGSVIMTGDRRDVPALMGAMNAFVLSSLSEGLSITLLEAMASSLPVVATRVGGNAEIVADGETGLLVEAGNPEALARAMMAVAGNPEVARRMGAAGRARVEQHFSERAMVARYAEVYDEVMGGPGS